MKYTVILAIFLFTLGLIPLHGKSQTVKFRWDAVNEKESVAAYTKQLKKLPLTETQVNSLANCAKDKFKTKFPNGINMPQEEFVELNDGFLSSCIADAKLIVIPVLTDELANLLTQQIQEKLPNAISSATKQKIGECFVATVREKYPKGFVFTETEKNLFQEKMYLINSDCAEKMSFSNVLSWNTETETLFKYGLTKDYTQNGPSAYAECFVAKVKSKYPTGFTVNQFNKAELTKAFEEIKKQCEEELKR